MIIPMSDGRFCPSLPIECPYCEAKSGEPCIDAVMKTRRFTWKVHPERKKVFRKTAVVIEPNPTPLRK